MNAARLIDLKGALTLHFAGADRAGDDQRLAAWLDCLPLDKPIVSCQMLESRLLETVACHRNLRLRLRHIQILQQALPPLIQGLESALASAPQPLPSPQRRVAAKVLGLLKGFALANLAVAREMSARWISIGVARPLEAALLEAARAIAMRIELGQRAYASGSASCWQHLLEVHRLARRHDCLDTAPAEAPGDSIAGLHARALLTTLADPGRLSIAQIDQLYFYLRRHSALVSFVAPSGLAVDQRNQYGLFVIENNGRPARPVWRDGALRPNAIIMDVRPLLRRLQRQIEALAQGAEPARIGLPIHALDAPYRSLLQSLVRQWQLPRARRHPRSRFLPRADLVAGFGQIRAFLADAAFARRAADARPAGNADSPGEWAIADESPGGFGLRYLGSGANTLQVADVCALRPRERSLVHLCVVRRAVNLGERAFEVGLEVLAAQGVSTTLSLPAEALGAPRSNVDVVLLPKVPALGHKPALLAPAAAVRPNCEFLIHWRGRKWRFVTGDAIERFESCELVPLRLQHGAPQ